MCKSVAIDLYAGILPLKSSRQSFISVAVSFNPPACFLSSSCGKEFRNFSIGSIYASPTSTGKPLYMLNEAAITSIYCALYSANCFLVSGNRFLAACTLLIISPESLLALSKTIILSFNSMNLWILLKSFSIICRFVRID